jgi:hypothetical protein
VKTTVVAGPGERAAQVTQAEALMLGVTRDAPGLRLALEHEHLARAPPAQLDRRGEPGRPRADDYDGPAHPRPSSSSAISAPQKKP